MYKIIGADGKEYGPATADHIRGWISSGRCDGRTMARLEGTTEWKGLGEFPDLAEALTSSSVPPMPPPGEPKVETSGLAIASLICGILGLFTCLPGPIGWVLGVMARRQIKKSNGQLGGAGLATAGIVISIFVTAVFVLLAAAGVLFPALAKAKKKAQTIQCEAHIQELTTVLIGYAKAHENQLPAADKWTDSISNKVSSVTVFHCPVEEGDDCSYAFNKNLDGKKLSEINPKTVLLFEADEGWNGSGAEPETTSRAHWTSRRNSGGIFATKEDICHVTFVDGTFAAIPESGLEALRWEP